MKILSWNVNGIRSVIKKGFVEFINNEKPDIICLQETKANKDQVELDLPNYEEYWNSAEKKGYAGTAIFTKIKPISVRHDIVFDGKKVDKLKDDYGDANNEGRVLTLEFDDFFLVNVYTPNSKRELTRLEYRYNLWDPTFLKYVKKLEKEKPVIFCGDLNVAHTEIDLARPKGNEKTHGFTKEEREGFDKILKAGFIDTLRIFNKERGNYTWWSPFAKARERNVGWRIDYFLVSKGLKSKVKSAFILKDQLGSDHCPIGITISE